MLKHTSKKQRLVYNNDKFYGLFLFLALASILLLFGPSLFLWENTPYLKYVQFPVRWLNITTFAIPLLAASFLVQTESARIFNKTGYVLIMALLLVSAAMDGNYIHRATIFSEQELLPVKGVNMAREHLPIGVQLEKLANEGDSGEKVTVVRGRGKAEVVLWKAAEREVLTTAEQPFTVRVRTFNFPGWTAYIDGIRGELKSEEGTMAMLVDVPAGKHHVRLSFRDTPARVAGKLVSIAMLAVFIVSLVTNIWNRKKASL